MNRFKDKNDETLVELTLLGNDKAYEELVARYGKLVTSVAYRVRATDFPPRTQRRMRLFSRG